MSTTDLAHGLDPATRSALCAYLLARADDELILGHRDSEWTGFAPQIEEDVAFSSIAQDEIGHAALYFGLVTGLDGGDADELALKRPIDGYTHAAMVERTNGDWAHTIARHYLYDLADACRIDVLSDSSYSALANVAKKMAREEHYHLMHGAAWWERLTNGTDESRARLLAAAGDLIPLAVDLFYEMPGEHDLVAAEIVPCPSSRLLEEWVLRVTPIIESLDPALLDVLHSAAPRPRPASVSAAFRELHMELTAVSASGLGERW